jgi:hypothetical protein
MTQVSSGETEAVAKKPETTSEHEKRREKKERVRPPTKVKQECKRFCISLILFGLRNVKG